MPNLETILEDLGIGNRENRNTDIKSIIARAIRQTLNENPIVTSAQVSRALKDLNKRGIIRNSVSDYSRSFVSPSTNQSIKEAGVDSILLIEAVKKCLGEIPGFEIKVHYNSTNSRGTIYFVDEDKVTSSTP